MQLILRTWNTDDLALNQTIKINVWICCDNIPRADIKSVRDSVKSIPRPDNISKRIWPTTVDWYVDHCPFYQAFRIDFRVYLQDAIFTDIKFSGYSAYSIMLSS